MRQFAFEFPFQNNCRASQYARGHLLIGCLLSFCLFVFVFKANLLKTLLLALCPLARAGLAHVIPKVQQLEGAGSEPGDKSGTRSRRQWAHFVHGVLDRAPARTGEA